MNITPSMSSLDLEAIYAESKVLFPETVKKTLDDIDDFYRKLLSNRIRRLSEQRNLLKLSHSDKLEESNLLKDKLDGLMKYLA